MKRYFQFVAIATTVVAFVSCGTTKEVQTNTYPNYRQDVSKKGEEVHLELSKTAQEAFDNQEAVSIEMLDFGFGRSGDKAKALRDALKSAQNNIAIRIYRAVTYVDKEFAQDIVLGDKITSKSDKADMIIGVVDRKVVSISYTKAPVFRKDKNIWECDVEVKLVPELLNSMTKEIYDSLSDDDEMKVKFSEKEFEEEVFNKVLDEYRKAQK